MKVQCMQCKEVVALGRFRIDGDAIEIRCPECGSSYRVAADSGERVSSEPPPRPSPVPGEGAQITCPKCGQAQPEAEACRACGLRRDRFADFVGGGPEEPPALADAWARCREQWEDAAAHDRYLEAVSLAKAFEVAARRYREAQRDQPGDERAGRGIERVTRMAEAALLTSSPRPEPAAREPYKNVLLVLLALVMLGGIFGIYALFRAKNVKEEEQEQERNRPSLRERRTPGDHPRPVRRQ